jgi:hypothetical protein
VCQPKVPPGLIVIDSTAIAPGLTLTVIAEAIVPTARGLATIGGVAPNDVAAVMSAAAVTRSVIFM